MGSSFLMNFCRLCAEESDRRIHIYEDEGQKLNLATKIRTCLTILVSREDPLPKTICPGCCSRLDACYLFVTSSVKAQSNLRMIYCSQLQGSSVDNVHDCSSMEVQVVKEEVDTGGLLDCIMLTEEELDKRHTSEGMGEITVPASDQKKARNNTEETSVQQLESKRGRPRRTKKAPQHYSPPPVGTRQSVRKQEAAQKHIEEDELLRDTSASAKLSYTEEHGSFSDLDLGDQLQSKAESKVLRSSGSSHVINSPWRCSSCSEIFLRAKQLTAHYREVHQESPKFKCNECNKSFNKYHTLCAHSRHHRNFGKYRCDDCGKVFSENKLLQSHRVIHSEEHPYVCEECGKKFKRPSSLYIHKRYHQPDDAKYKYPCDICGKLFITKTNMDVHRKTHTGEKHFTCDVCGKSFIQKGNLDCHMLSHSGDRPFRCNTCERRFKTKSQLKKHRKIHTDERPFQCSSCGHNFREKTTLQEHERVHTGELPFICDFCGKCFRFKGTLRVHRRLHTGERPYSCQECQRDFTNRPNYNKHMKRRHGYGVGRNDKKKPPASEQQQVAAEILSYNNDFNSRKEGTEEEGVSQQLETHTTSHQNSKPTDPVTIQHSVFQSCELPKGEERITETVFSRNGIKEQPWEQVRITSDIFLPQEQQPKDDRIPHTGYESSTQILHERLPHSSVFAAVHGHNGDEESIPHAALFQSTEPQGNQEERLTRDMFQSSQSGTFPLPPINATRELARTSQTYLSAPQSTPHGCFMGPSIQ